MDLRSLSAALWRRRGLILVTILGLLATVAFGLSRQSPTYTATAVMRFATVPVGAPDWLEYDVTYTDRLQATCVELAQQPALRTAVQLRLGLDEMPGISVESVARTELLTIGVTHGDPTIAATIANQLATMVAEECGRILAEEAQANVAALTAELARLRDEESSGDPVLDAQRSARLDRTAAQLEQRRLWSVLQGGRLSLIVPAVPPTSADGPDSLILLALAGLFGAGVAVVLALVVDNFNTRLDDPLSVQSVSDLPLLTEIPHKRKITPHDQGGPWDSDLMQAFIQLEAKLRSLPEWRTPMILTVTSAIPQAGKTLVAIYLARAAAQRDRRVLLVDGDLAHPTLHTRFGLPNETGLRTVYAGRGNAQGVITPTEFPALHLLSTGPATAKEETVLSPEWLAHLFGQLANEYDLIIVDGPALLGSGNATQLAAASHAALMVVRLRHDHEPALVTASAHLERIAPATLGIVLTDSAEWNSVHRFGRRATRYYQGGG